MSDNRISSYRESLRNGEKDKFKSYKDGIRKAMGGNKVSCEIKENVTKIIEK